ncbi:cysteine--tRNA ligase [Entomospira culicis]|nr:cysteine--tRNA ligase [Entomospira culicis]WDI37802.1 cysteine--tRNA ligase [Entomospira culicis]WDI39430.1 cysteine--tRNA ligase [Entomospira culicis]
MHASNRIGGTMKGSLYIYNTLSREKELFKPIHADKVSLYCCGPTVYNYAHIGNLRTYLFEDILRRTLELLDYEVMHVVNITDVGHLSGDGDEGEDKVLQSARAKGMGVHEIAEFFTQAFLQDCALLNIKPAHHYPRATAYIASMITFIEILEQKGFTYQAGGNLYFDSSKDPEYGALRGYREVVDAHARVVQADAKRSSGDFVLWFTQSKFPDQAMVWPSPWGVGYPGWHLECSVLSHEYLGVHFDIHCGGVDHIATHHTNEMAQNFGHCGSVGANYWVHGEFLLMGNAQKMSKSSGEFYTLNRLEELGIDPLAYRYFLLQTHYRKQLTFSLEALKGAQQALHRLRARIRELAHVEPTHSDATQTWLSRAWEALLDDLGTPELLSILWQVMKSETLNNGEKLKIALELEKILALDLFSVAETVSPQVDEDLLKFIEQKIKERAIAREKRDFVSADRVRDELLAMDIILVDEPSGTTWHVKE